MGLILGLLTSRLAGPIASVLCVLLLLFGLSQCSGRVKAEHHLSKLQKQIAKAEADARRREGVAQKIADTTKAAVTQERIKIEYRTKTLIREVPTYVTPADDARCTVNAGFVRLHDAAASGSPSLPQPAGGSDEAASGVQLSTVLSTVVGNYGVAYDWRAEALGWREWYARQKEAWERR